MKADWSTSAHPFAKTKLAEEHNFLSDPFPRSTWPPQRCWSAKKSGNDFLQGMTPFYSSTTTQPANQLTLTSKRFKACCQQWLLPQALITPLKAMALSPMPLDFNSLRRPFNKRQWSCGNGLKRKHIFNDQNSKGTNWPKQEALLVSDNYICTYIKMWQYKGMYILVCWDHSWVPEMSPHWWPSCLWNIMRKNTGTIN